MTTYGLVPRKTAKIDRQQKEFLKAMKKKFSEPSAQATNKGSVGDPHPTLLPYRMHMQIAETNMPKERER
jgi:hypothetical protein